jgi:uncharacterized protein (DUF169 family)
MEMLQKFKKALDEHLALPTPPVAIKLLMLQDDVPPEMGRPLNDLGEAIRPCEAWHATRHLGLPVAMLEEDFSAGCPTALFVFGIMEPIQPWIEGDLAYDMYTSSREAAANMEKNVFRIGVGKYKGLAFAPLGKENFTPDLIMIHCNSRQALRLITAAEWKTGDPLKITMAARDLCSDGVMQPFLTGRPVIAIPCWGDRRLGMAQDHEIVFTTPVSELDGIINGLESFARWHKTEKLGKEPMFRELYMKMEKSLNKKLGR